MEHTTARYPLSDRLVRSRLGAVLLLAGLVGAPAASADVAPDIEHGKTFVEHHVRIDNLKAHPNWVILVHDAPRNGEIRANLAFEAGGEAEQLLVNGRSWRSASRYSKPSIWLVSKTEYEAWKKATSTLINKQREACAERGEGCAHISRFQPHYPPPKGAIDCKAQITAITQRPSAEGSRAVDAFKLEKAGPGVCKLTQTKKAQDSGSLVVPPGGGFPWLMVVTVLAVLLSGGLLAYQLRSRKTGAPSATQPTA